MKPSKIISTFLTLTLLIVASVVYAQHPAVSDYYSHYKGHSDVHRVSLDGGIFKLVAMVASLENDEESEALSRITKNLEGMEIIVVPKRIEEDYKFTDVIKHIKKDNYGELMNMREDGRVMKFYAQGEEDEIRDLLVFIDDKDEYCILALKGMMNMEDLQFLARNNNTFR